MRFDVNRLSQLAGLEKGSSGLLGEASNRSYHDGVASDTVDERWGKNQLNEKRPALRQYEGEYEDGEMNEYGLEAPGEDIRYGADVRGAEATHSKTHPGRDDFLEELDDADFLGEEDEEDPEADVVLEIDEGMLRREIRRMKSERMNENKLRLAVRNEIHDIFDDLGISDSSWVYGNNKPRNSKQGRVNMSFTGPGFW